MFSKFVTVIRCRNIGLKDIISILSAIAHELDGTLSKSDSNILDIKLTKPNSHFGVALDLMVTLEFYKMG